MDIEAHKIEADAVFEILVRENAAMLRTYLRAAVCDATDVDDLFQEAIIVAWRRLDEFDRSRPFGPWLRGIAARLVMAHFRKAARRGMLWDEGLLEHLDRRVQHIADRPGDTWDEKIEALQECIRALPNHYRQTIRRRYMEEEPACRVAASLKLSLETVKKQLQRARARLLDCLRRKRVVAEVDG
jgi:RNA polymerase sigma-70 factor